VIVNHYHRKAAGIILRSERADYRLNRGNFIPCGYDRSYARPFRRSRELRAIGIEFPYLPEISTRKKQHEPNNEHNERNEN